MMKLDLQTLQRQSRDRAARWHEGAEPWSLLEWAGAMCGESGEAANIAKKIKRIDQGMWNNAFTPASPADLQGKRQQLCAALARETADAILYGICLLNELDVDAGDVIRAVFNQKSQEAGFPEAV